MATHPIDCIPLLFRKVRTLVSYWATRPLETSCQAHPSSSARLYLLGCSPCHRNCKLRGTVCALALLMLPLQQRQPQAWAPTGCFQKTWCRFSHAPTVENRLNAAWLPLPVRLFAAATCSGSATAVHALRVGASVCTLCVPLCTLCVCLCARSACASVCGHSPVPQSPSSVQQSGADASTL